MRVPSEIRPITRVYPVRRAWPAARTGRVITVARFSSGDGRARTRRAVGAPAISFDVVEKWLLEIRRVLDGAVFPRRKLLDRPETFSIVDVNPIEGEPSWIVFDREGRVFEQAVPRLDR